MAVWAVGSIPCCVYRQEGDCGDGQQRVEQVGTLAGFRLLMDESRGLDRLWHCDTVVSRCWSEAWAYLAILTAVYTRRSRPPHMTAAVIFGFTRGKDRHPVRGPLTYCHPWEPPGLQAGGWNGSWDKALRQEFRAPTPDLTWAAQ